MTISDKQERFFDHNLHIEQHDIELEDSEIELNFFSRLPDNNALILIQFLEGEPEITPDIPFPEVFEERPSGRVFMGAMNQGARALIHLVAKGIVRARIIFAQVRKQFVAAKRAFPCRFCKLAVNAILFYGCDGIRRPNRNGHIRRFDLHRHSPECQCSDCGGKFRGGRKDTLFVVTAAALDHDHGRATGGELGLRYHRRVSNCHLPDDRNVPACTSCAACL